MNPTHSDRMFSGSIPQLYESLMVPLIFEPCAVDIAKRVVALGPTAVLEVAAGTGVVTRHMAAMLPTGTAITATDLNQPMLDHAASVGTARPVAWQQADGMKLPFADGSFDVVVCQFGVMFFPDRAVAFAESRRVLRPGGTFIFNVWDRIELNEFADLVTAAISPMFPADPPRFLARTPHGYNDVALIARDLAQGGFVQAPEFHTLAARSRADSARAAATAYLHGTPLHAEILARDANRLDEAIEVATIAIARQFGQGAVDGGIQALVVAVRR